ncbi:DUF1559 domain-containing protein [Blastopirellula marina]|nr:DUF1559 domain-containing protein [Blastopirellula marina]
MNDPQPPERPPARNYDTPIMVVVGILAFFGIAFVLLPGTGHPRSVSYRMQSTNNLKQIGLALHNYHDMYGELPPAYIVDENGRPLTSWRVLLLPLLEQKALYDQFDLDAPWDSPTNLPLVQQMPQIYTSPYFYGTQSQGRTPYLGIVDAIDGGTILRPGKGRTMKEVADGPSNTAMVIDDPGRMVIWTKPDDIDPLELLTMVPWDQNDLHGILVLRGDVSVQHLSEQERAQLVGLIFCDDGRIPKTAP